jgi:hypothetical protein
MNTLRNAVGKTQFDNVSNQHIRQQSGIQPIGEWILKRREKWDNHISKMTELSELWQIRYQKEEGTQNDSRSADPTLFLQEIGYQPNRKK